MLCTKREYDRDVIINMCLEFCELKSNKREFFFMNSSIKF